MKLSQLFESVGAPNKFFRVDTDMKVWQGISGQSGPTFKTVSLQEGDELHWLKGGLFAIRDGITIDSIHVNNPDNRGEAEYHKYRNNPTGFVSEELGQLVTHEHIKEIPQEEAAKVQYR